MEPNFSSIITSRGAQMAKEIRGTRQAENFSDRSEHAMFNLWEMMRLLASFIYFYFLKI